MAVCACCFGVFVFVGGGGGCRAVACVVASCPDFGDDRGCDVVIDGIVVVFVVDDVASVDANAADFTGVGVGVAHRERRSEYCLDWIAQQLLALQSSPHMAARAIWQQV